MFAPKDLRPSEIMALRTFIGGRTGNMPPTLEGIIESACLWACPEVGFQGKVPESVKQGWQGGEVGSRGGGESTARKAQAPARPLKAIE